MLFFTFYTLLCALVTVNTTYSIYFFLIHHCTNSLSSLHIFVHHCTFSASLHTKTSPFFARRLSRSYASFTLTTGSIKWISVRNADGHHHRCAFWKSLVLWDLTM